MKLGIIITSYNNQDTLEKAINSAAKLKKNNKTYIVLVDDCSKDLTLKIIKKAKENNQIDYIHLNKVNLGVSKCRNIGINLCKNTDYVTFLDGDDFLNPKFSRIIKRKFFYGDLIAFNFNYHYKDNISKNFFYKKDKDLSTKDIKTYFHQYLIKPNKNSLFTTCWSKLYKTNLLRSEKKVFFDKKLFLCEDTDFVFRFLSKVKFVQYIDFPMYIHTLVKGKGNLNKATFGSKLPLRCQISFLSAIESCKNYLIKNNDKLSIIQTKINHCIGAYTIIYTIRSCIKINSFYDFIKTYLFWKKIYKKKIIYNSINDYSPKLAGGGKWIPYLIKNKIYLLAIIVAFLFSRKRYF